jgi:hypothetical protein
VDEKVIHIEKKKNRDIKRKYKYYNQIGNAIINYKTHSLLAKIDF